MTEGGDADDTNSREWRRRRILLEVGVWFPILCTITSDGGIFLLKVH
jgi:hypothetical protein